MEIMENKIDTIVISDWNWADVKYDVFEGKGIDCNDCDCKNGEYCSVLQECLTYEHNFGKSVFFKKSK